MRSSECYHCGSPCHEGMELWDDKNFCCKGCKTVYEVFKQNDLCSYYDLQANPGAVPTEIRGKYDFLENDGIVSTLVDFNDSDIQSVTLSIPHIHCSSCIWILENLYKLNSGVITSQVNFPKKTVHITYRPQEISLKQLVLLLCRIGYEPYISLQDSEAKRPKVNRRPMYQVGVAGFAFGNVMLLSFPEYFEVNEYWLDQYRPFFRWLILFLSLPAVFYSGSDYIRSAISGLRSGMLNIDVPIALGILTLFGRSAYEIISGTGPGFFDSLTGLIFFLLLGKVFQQRTYNFLSFERDYKSYFPIGVTKVGDGGRCEESIPVHQVKKGDRLLIRNEELIPVDSILIKGRARIDYSFVTGESDPVNKESGDKLFAGGRQTHGAIEIEALTTVSQSYLTQLWSNKAFKKEHQGSYRDLTDRVSKYFTWVILAIALTALAFWSWYDPSKALTVFTAVLIIACPCALALSAPFTLGNLLRIFGKHRFYLKDAQVIEKMAQIDMITFDKTGTITASKKSDIQYRGFPLDEDEESLLRTTLRNSSHPLSRQLYDLLDGQNITVLDSFHEETGRGLTGEYQQHSIRVGSATFVGVSRQDSKALGTEVHVSTERGYKGRFTFANQYRQGIAGLFRVLGTHYELAILSGDNASERENLNKLLPVETKMFFDQKPEQKLEYVAFHQEQERKVMMVGDGLNDAGALAQSDVGVAISENVNVFSPACDAILDARKLSYLGKYLKACKQATHIIIASFVLSFLYNIVGISFAVSGSLSPLVAAILMPLSSITVVAFATGMTLLIGRSLNKRIR